MKYSIQIMNTILIVDDKSLTGYAFIDENKHCIIIVYGERKRDLLIDLLSSSNG
jgi:hypothetical protein